jgi:hypothetical protein
MEEPLSLELGGYALFSGMNGGVSTVAVLVHVERRQPARLR